MYLDMRLFVESVLAEEPWKYDSKVIPMPWRLSEVETIKSRISSGSLTIGYYECDGNVSLEASIISSSSICMLNCRTPA